MVYHWRLGLDLGTSSLGWCALELGADGRPRRIIAAGSRIFGAGENGAGREAKSGKPLGESRREARAMRRRRDRYKRRRAALVAHLVKDGLFPTDPAERKALERLDPFVLRARGLDEKLDPFETGRALFHLGQRRGFKSNRKTDRGAADDTGKIAVGVDRLRAAIEQVVAAGLGHHSDFRDGEVFHDETGQPALPYYGVALEGHIMPGTADPSDPEEMRVGRLTNPTVHIGLNQLRRTVNALIRSFGQPAEIAVELARQLKLSLEEKSERERENTKNRLEAEARSKKLTAIGQTDNGANRALLKLWEELSPHNVLDRRCIYTGEVISIAMLFSGEVEVDHILPFEATLDDSNANKIVCLRSANRDKRKRSPFEAFGHTARWEEIAARAARLPSNKRWRFQADAMQRFDKDGGFIARQLVDTQYLSRLAREYLSTLYPEKGDGSSHVWVSPGRMTEMVRRKLGLNDLLPDHNFGGGADQQKNRKDHRHHAIDAAVVAIIDRSMLQRIARASGSEGEAGRERIIVEAPWPGFRDELREVVGRIVVSHRPDHGLKPKAKLKQVPPPHMTAGRLHNDTAYGFTGERDAKNNTIVVHRVPLGTLKPDTLARVRDKGLREALTAFTRSLDGKPFEAALAAFSERGPLSYRGIRRLRVTEPLAVIPICDRSGRAYKGYKGDSNYRYDVWELKDGRWVSEVVSMFDAHQQGRVSRVRAANPTARKVLSLHQDDVVAIESQDGDRRLMRVVKFGQSGQVTLAATHEAGDLKRRDALPNDDDPFKYVAPTPSGLQRMRTRQVRVDELGRVSDPGFPARTARRRTRPKPA